MVAYKNQAWVTAVLNDGDANKATVLAGSLRRVLTTKKVCAVFTPNVSEDARDLLRDKFDLAVLIDKKIPDGVNPEDFAKIFAFSFNVFNKCVYLSSSTMVLQNCDEIFENTKSFAALRDEDGIDTSVFAFTPSTRHYKAMRKIVGNGHVWKGSTSDAGHFSKYFGKWLLNQEPSAFSLHARYNQKMSLLDEMEIYDGLQSDLVVVNFVNIHPIEVADKIISSSITTLGIVESFVADIWLTIYMEEVRTRSCLQSEDISSAMDSDNPTEENEPIAIIGMSCRYPGASNVDEFWKLLVEGREGIQQLPMNRWTKNTSIIPTTRRDVNAGFLNVPIDEFDAKFFGISPKEAVFLDPQQRLLHEVTWECLEDAAVDPLSLRGTHMGVFVGSWIHDYKDIVVRMPDVDFFRVYMGNSIAAGAARLSYFLGTTGPSIATESGCSSAIVAVDMACKSLRNRDSNLAIACGVNLLIHPFDQNMLSFVVAPDGRCKTFDAKANGFGRAEGCGVLLMKRLSDAIKDGDKIWGLVKGSAITQEGISKSLGTPTVQCEALAMELALKDAGVEPRDVSFVETHGTGTPVGDPMEIAAITKTYSKGRTEPLWIGSVKTNIGHTESVSGITGIMKVILSMKNEIIPRHLNFETMNPDINMDIIPAEIPLTEVAWPRTSEKPRIAGVSSFGISGTDGHIIVQESPNTEGHSSSTQIALKCKRPLHIMKVSAKCQESLDELLQKYREAFEQAEDVDFADLAYTGNVGRATFNHRAVIIAKDAKEAANIIEKNSMPRKEVQPSGGKLCFLFTGQGSQYPGMAEELYEASPVFRMSFDKCNHLLQKMYGISIKDTLWNSKDSEELSRTLYSQTSIFCVEYCLLKLWKSWGVEPDYVLGHSLGEFAAAVAAGVLTLKGALSLVAERSRLIDDLPRGKMIVIKADKPAVNKLLSEFTSINKGAWLDYAAVNAFDQTVLAGDTETINEFAGFCETKNLKTIILAATHAFHSRHMDPMLNSYRNVASKIKPGNYENTPCEYISGMEGSLVEKESLLRPDYWTRHTREKVNFIEACRAAHNEGCTYFLEVGPHPVLSALAMANIDGPGLACFPSLRRKQDDWATILESVGKLYLSDWNGSFNWKRFDEYFPRKKVALPFYPFSRKKIWADVLPIPPKLHPLIGGSVENASSVTLFENRLTLKQAPYLNDHVIGSSVVFPGAGFLEMLLAGGHCHVQCLTDEFTHPRRPITLKDMKIESPLGIDDMKATTLQVVVDLQEETSESGASQSGYKTKVFHWHTSEEDGSGHWVVHASAMFVPIVTEDSIQNMEVVNVKEIQEQWAESQMSSELYKKLPEVGLKFGSTFQSLESGWRKKKGKDEKENSKGNESMRKDDSLLVAVKVPQDTESYIAHPVLVDAMIQAAMLWSSNKDRLHKRLHVPVHIQEFTWLRGTDSPSRFVYCSNDNQDVMRVTLLDGEGLPLMTMTGIDFVETSASVVESIIQQQSSQVLTLWEETWRPRPGHLESQMAYEIIEDEETLFSSNELARAYEFNILDPNTQAVYDHLDKITVVHFLNSLYEIGWSPKLGDKFTISELMEELSITEAFKNFTKFFVKSLVEDEMLGRDENDQNIFVVDQRLPTKSQLSAKLRHTVVDCETSRADFKTIYEIGGKLKDILQGRLPPLAVLFPEGSGIQFADATYEVLYGVVQKSSELLLNSIIGRYTREFSNEQNKEAKVRILEVGAGTGMQTGMFLGILENIGLPFEYYYTDISAAFFNKAEEKFQKYKNHLKFKKFNIEEDPLTQGYSPGFFDLVIGAEVIHAARNIREALANLRLVMRDGASIKILETTNQDRKITFIFGMLEGYWRFQDFDLRQDHPTLSPEAWENVLNTSGFELAVAVPCYNSVHSAIFAVARKSYFPNGMYTRRPVHVPAPKPKWLIFGNDTVLCETLTERLTSLDREVKYLSKKENYDKMVDKSFIEGVVGSCEENKKTGEKVEGIIYLWGVVGEDVHDQAQFVKPFLSLCQFLWDNQKMAPKTFVITRGALSVDESKYLNPSPSTLVGVCKVLKTETSLPVKCIDLPSNKSLEEQIEQIFYELWYHGDMEDLITYRMDKRFAPKLAAFKPPNENLNLPKGSDRFQLILPATRMIADLEFGFLNCYTLGEHEIELKVKASALNFRDVFAVIKPDPQFDNINSIGLDFAGVVTGIGSKVTKWKVGDAAFGCQTNFQQALPSHIKLNDEALVPMPEYFSFAEAATLPAVFTTSFYCLKTVANIQSTDTILIHTGSGGVGLSAIQIAHHYGARVIATAGSERKRAYLRSLGIQHVFHSRNTNYGDEILEATNGKGVDIVLNSLTGPGFKEATLKCSAHGARFIEMSKLSIWQPEEVEALRPDVKYTIVDLSSMDEPVWKSLFESMRDFVNEGVMKPIPYVRFDAVNIRAALNYMQKAKHIGKIVCVMPETKLKASKLTSFTPLFNDRSTYIITGGVTGGIGLETAKFMLSQGAKHIFLVGRSKPHEKAQELLNLWKASGYHVEACSADVGNYEQCKALIDKIRSPDSGCPPIRGVMHAAGTLSDGTLPNQTWEKFEHTYNAKVEGSWNLHRLTLDCQLEHFVFFSSMAALIGTPGQANHSSGNTFEDSLAHYRNSIGLPATSINWGPWGQVGIATDIDIPGFRPLSTLQGITSMEYILRTCRVQVGVWNVDSYSILAKYIPGIEHYIDDRSFFTEMKGPVFNLNSDEFWSDVDGVEDREEKEEVFRHYIKIMVRSILKLDPEEAIDDNVEFQSLGVDSLMMLEMKNNLQNLFGSRMTVSASDLKGCNTTHLLSSKLVDILLSASAADEVPLSLEELRMLVIEDSKLAKTVIPADQGVKCPSQCKTVLVTGATGMLAPYIIQLISKMSQITRIVCLIRKRGKIGADKRFTSTLEKNGLLQSTLMDKIECIDGDVGQPQLGLSDEQYDNLAESIDCVFHCAAKVDHLQTYRKTAHQEKFHTRVCNVLGTKHVLEFAASKRTKFVYHAGTFASIYSQNKKQTGLSEDWENIEDLEKVPMNNGYAISKYVAEQLVKQAVARGIPCKSFRLPFLSGDSKTGWHDIRGNHAMLRFLTYMKVRALPTIPVPILTLPVDYCAEVTTKLFFDETPLDVYNVVPPKPELEQEFPRIAKQFGYDIEIVEYSEFLQRIKNIGDSSPIHAFMETYQDEDAIQKLSTCPAIPSIEVWVNQEAYDSYFHSEKLQKYCPDLYSRMGSPLEGLKRDLQFLKDTGIFEKFGL